jgi:hypothetical protein
MVVSGDDTCPSSFVLPFSDCALHGTGNCVTGTLECSYPPNRIGSLASLDLTGDFTVNGSQLTAPMMTGPVLSDDGSPLHCTFSATAVLP